MRAPRDMKIIEIDVTNVCDHKCSNCTRFCGHHEKTFYMDLEYFKKAVDSLEGFEGTIGIIGGEPTLHPQFEEIANYVGSKFPQYEGKDRQLLHPQASFMRSIQDLEASHRYPKEAADGARPVINGAGLLSTMGQFYGKHYETIQDNFKFQILNDHMNEIYHQPILISRKDLQIPDDEWEVMRDNCWLQNEWSASITPKGCFFCEVAGTLDMLFDGDGGWELEPNWWKRDVADFKDQLHWCELCGLACETFSRNANEERDDASPILFEKLKKINSPRLKNNMVNLVEIDDKGYISEESKTGGKWFNKVMPYAESVEAKFNMINSVLFPKGFDAIYYVDGDIKEIENFNNTFAQFNITYVICEDNKIKESFANEIKQNDKTKIYSLTEKSHEDIMSEILVENKRDFYLVNFSNGVLPKEDFVSRMIKYIFNPGTLIVCDNVIGDEVLVDWITTSDNDIQTPFYIFNRIATSLRGNKDKITNINDLKSIWNERKVIDFDKDLFYSVPETNIQKGGRYAMYGTGISAHEYYEKLIETGAFVSFVVDSNVDKQGQDFKGMIIEAPENLKVRKNDYDYILISSHNNYMEIKTTLLEMGFAQDKIKFIF